MMHLLIVADGKRDAATLPHLVQTILGISTFAETQPWARLHDDAGKGYRRKLLYCIRQAIHRNLVGVVAVVDRDTDKNRFNDLVEARTADRLQRPPFPTVLGMAIPHGEAWLLDDPAAVRIGIGLASDVEIPAPTKVDSPKSTLENLHLIGPRSGDRFLDVLEEVAKNVRPARCIHWKATGFQRFQEEVTAELGPLAKS